MPYIHMKRILCSNIVLFLVVILAVDNVSSFSVSVPPVKSVCRSMQPGHDKYKPQTIDSPFSVSTDISEVQGGSVVEVLLQGSGNKTFKGYYLQARDSNDSPIGMFNSNTLAKVHSCGGIRANAAHHANSEEKNRIAVSWMAPKRYSGEITFTATFVENYVVFWTQVKAQTIKVVS
ncbi:unnamed protein product [Orchesella dallaii]|uniref:Reelin domain-containing protein n=1 Tax=Orchesella dallaii TaxID=48710 RepID=A0ABP1QC56_9HEXA